MAILGFPDPVDHMVKRRKQQRDPSLLSLVPIPSSFPALCSLNKRKVFLYYLHDDMSMGSQSIITDEKTLVVQGRGVTSSAKLPFRLELLLSFCS